MIIIRYMVQFEVVCKNNGKSKDGMKGREWNEGKGMKWDGFLWRSWTLTVGALPRTPAMLPVVSHRPAVVSYKKCPLYDSRIFQMKRQATHWEHHWSSWMLPAVPFIVKCRHSTFNIQHSTFNIQHASTIIHSKNIIEHQPFEFQTLRQNKKTQKITAEFQNPFFLARSA